METKKPSITAKTQYKIALVMAAYFFIQLLRL